MEKMLRKLASQLDALDEASLMALWSKYATLTSRFEPTLRWQENCLIFSLIQAKHWKNQLFNYALSQQRKPPLKSAPNAPDIANDFTLESADGKTADTSAKNTCRVISFTPDLKSGNSTMPADPPEKDKG